MKRTDYIIASDAEGSKDFANLLFPKNSVLSDWSKQEFRSSQSEIADIAATLVFRARIDTSLKASYNQSTPEKKCKGYLD
ncbi:MAG: hypothetical protein RMM16_04450 [Chloroherpetonaceae bacterium]|nr:hypothetical protein [Chloroherpetonaceae bacterium]